MEGNYRKSIDFSREILRGYRKSLKRESAFIEILNKLYEYQVQVSELALFYDQIERIIRQSLSDLFIPKKKLLEDLIQEIYEIEIDFSSEGNPLISESYQKLKKLQRRFQDLQPTNLQKIMHQLSIQLKISSNESEQNQKPEVVPNSLKKKSAFVKIRIKLDKYKAKVSELAQSYGWIETMISQALSDLLILKKKLLEDLMQEIDHRVKKINDIKRDSVEEGDILISEFEDDELIERLDNFKDLQHFDLHQIMHKLNKKLNRYSNESAFQIIIQNPQTQLKYSQRAEQKRLIHPIPKLLNTLQGHTGYVNSVCMSADNRWIVSVSYDDSIRLWNVETNSQEAILQGYTSSVNSVCMSADSRLIVSGSCDNSIKLWNVETKQEAILQGHTDYVYSVCTSADSRWIVSGSCDNSVRIWNVETKSQEAILKGHTSFVNSVCMSADSRWIVSGSEDESIRLWNVETKSQEAILQGHTSSVNSVFMSADSRWIVSGSYDTSVRLWSLETMSQKAMLQGHTDSVLSVCMSADSRWIVSGSGDNSIRLWSVETKSQEAILQGHTDTVTSVCMSADSRSIVSVSWDTSVRLWRLYEE